MSYVQHYCWGHGDTRNARSECLVSEQPSLMATLVSHANLLFCLGYAPNPLSSPTAAGLPVSGGVRRRLGMVTSISAIYLGIWCPLSPCNQSSSLQAFGFWICKAICVCVYAVCKGRRSDGATGDQTLRILLRIVRPLLFLSTWVCSEHGYMAGVPGRTPVSTKELSLHRMLKWQMMLLCVGPSHLLRNKQ